MINEEEMFQDLYQRFYCLEQKYEKLKAEHEQLIKIRTDNDYITAILTPAGVDQLNAKRKETNDWIKERNPKYQGNPDVVFHPYTYTNQIYSFLGDFGETGHAGGNNMFKNIYMGKEESR